jgi:hypothetical protein
MEDERRKFLQQLIALGGGEAMLPDFVEAVQSEPKLERPITVKILKRETTRTDPFTDTTIELEVSGASGSISAARCKSSEMLSMHFAASN